MRTPSFVAGALAAIALVAAPAAAQSTSPTVNGKLLQVTPYAGFMAFGNYLDGPLGTSLSSAGGALYGAQLGMKLMPNVSLVGNVALSRGDLQVGLPLVGGLDVGKAEALVGDAALQLDLPIARQGGLPLIPFVQAGAGAMRHDIALGESVLGGAIQGRATNMVGVLGAGVDIPFGSGMALRGMVRDYVGKFDAREIIGLDAGTKTQHNFAFTAGLKIEF